MKRSGFKRAELPKRERATVTVRSEPARATLRRSDGKARMSVAIPKTAYVRSEALREAYRLIPCQFEGCGIDDGTVCCCHSNWAVHGKGGRIKASDDRAASGCAKCHAELDSGKAWSEAEKQRRFWIAHYLSVTRLVGDGHWPRDIPVPDIWNCTMPLLNERGEIA